MSKAGICNRIVSGAGSVNPTAAPARGASADHIAHQTSSLATVTSVDPKDYVYGTPTPQQQQQMYQQFMQLAFMYCSMQGPPGFFGQFGMPWTVPGYLTNFNPVPSASHLGLPGPNTGPAAGAPALSTPNFCTKLAAPVPAVTALLTKPAPAVKLEQDTSSLKVNETLPSKLGRGECAQAPIPPTFNSTALAPCANADPVTHGLKLEDPLDMFDHETFLQDVEGDQVSIDASYGNLSMDTSTATGATTDSARANNQHNDTVLTSGNPDDFLSSLDFKPDLGDLDLDLLMCSGADSDLNNLLNSRGTSGANTVQGPLAPPVAAGPPSKSAKSAKPTKSTAPKAPKPKGGVQKLSRASHSSTALSSLDDSLQVLQDLLVQEDNRCDNTDWSLNLEGMDLEAAGGFQPSDFLTF